MHNSTDVGKIIVISQSAVKTTRSALRYPRIATGLKSSDASTASKTVATYAYHVP